MPNEANTTATQGEDHRHCQCCAEAFILLLSLAADMWAADHPPTPGASRSAMARGFIQQADTAWERAMSAAWPTRAR